MGPSIRSMGKVAVAERVGRSASLSGASALRRPAKALRRERGNPTIRRVDNERAPATADRRGAIVEPVRSVHRRRRPRITGRTFVGSVAALLLEVCDFLVGEELPAIELVRSLERRQRAIVPEPCKSGAPQAVRGVVQLTTSVSRS